MRSPVSCEIAKPSSINVRATSALLVSASSSARNPRKYGNEEPVALGNVGPQRVAQAPRPTFGIGEPTVRPTGVHLAYGGVEVHGVEVHGLVGTIAFAKYGFMAMPAALGAAVRT